jgi:curved DNA-binding protein CbpA
VAPVANRDFDPSQATLTPHDYFVLTRIDGKTSFRMILQLTGFPEPQTIAILQKLREEGAILLPGEPPPPKRLRVVAQPVPPTQPPTTPPRGTKPTPVLDPEILAETCDLSMEQKTLVLGKHLSLKLPGATLFDVLDCAPDADKKALKRAYFKISKDFHPDRFYGKNLGSYQVRLAEIFKAASDAWEVLEDDARRGAYLERLAGAKVKTQSQADHAAALFDQACQHEVTGEVATALKEFAAAIRLDPQSRYLKRAALAALKAQELRSAEEYATKAAEIDPRDATAHRTLAKVFRAAGRIQDALHELELATQHDPENPHMAAELDEIRRELTKS